MLANLLKSLQMFGFTLNFMFELLIYLIAVVVLFVAGFYSGVKNAESKKVQWGKELIRKLKSKD